MSENPTKHASPAHDIDEHIAARWSPYAYDSRPVEKDKLLSCFEALRWAASSYNEQPWSFIVAPREDTEAFNQMLTCLVDANQQWAKHAGALILTVVSRKFTKNGKPNRVAEHDMGLAMGNFCYQATKLGLDVHQMAGIEPAKARQAYSIPEDYDPFTAVAIGYAADPESFSDQELAKRDNAPRSRKPLEDFIYAGQWLNTAPLVK